MPNQIDKRGKQLAKKKMENEIAEQILDWIIDNPFAFLLLLVGASYLTYKISKALFYHIQTLNEIAHLVNSFRKLSKASPF
ncbi:MAG: hypothetical protein ACTSWZ_02125 [Candidatus Heimdallarchaeaceae archaeon]